MIKIVLISILLFLLHSCRDIEKEFQDVVSINTIQAYEEFIRKNSDSPYANEAKKKLRLLRHVVVSIEYTDRSKVLTATSVLDALLKVNLEDNEVQLLYQKIRKVLLLDYKVSAVGPSLLGDIMYDIPHKYTWIHFVVDRTEYSSKIEIITPGSNTSWTDKVIINDLDEKGVTKYTKFPTKLFVLPNKKDIDFKSDDLHNHIMKSMRILDFIKDDESEPLFN